MVNDDRQISPRIALYECHSDRDDHIQIFSVDVAYTIVNVVLCNVHVRVEFVSINCLVTLKEFRCTTKTLSDTNMFSQHFLNICPQNL